MSGLAQCRRQMGQIEISVCRDHLFLLGQYIYTLEPIYLRTQWLVPSSYHIAPSSYHIAHITCVISVAVCRNSMRGPKLLNIHVERITGSYC